MIHGHVTIQDGVCQTPTACRDAHFSINASNTYISYHSMGLCGHIVSGLTTILMVVSAACAYTSYQ
jgi:hypothetical protein